MSQAAQTLTAPVTHTLTAKQGVQVINHSSTLAAVQRLVYNRLQGMACNLVDTNEGVVDSLGIIQALQVEACEPYAPYFAAISAYTALIASTCSDLSGHSRDKARETAFSMLELSIRTDTN